MAKNQQRQTTHKYDGCSSQITNNETNESLSVDSSFSYERCMVLIEENMELQRKIAEMDHLLAVCHSLENKKI